MAHQWAAWADPRDLNSLRGPGSKWDEPPYLTRTGICPEWSEPIDRNWISALVPPPLSSPPLFPFLIPRISPREESFRSSFYSHARVWPFFPLMYVPFDLASLATTWLYSLASAAYIFPCTLKTEGWHGPGCGHGRSEHVCRIRGRSRKENARRGRRGYRTVIRHNIEPVSNRGIGEWEGPAEKYARNREEKKRERGRCYRTFSVDGRGHRAVFKLLLRLQWAVSIAELGDANVAIAVAFLWIL